MVPNRQLLNELKSGLACVDVSSSDPEYRQLGDDELMRRLFYRDRRAFEAMFDRYGDLVYSTALRVLRDPHLAEDISQEIFVRLWRKPDSYVAERGRFLTWLISVTRNRAVDEVRSRGRRQRHETASPEEQERELPARNANDPALNALLAEGARGGLPPRLVLAGRGAEGGTLPRALNRHREGAAVPAEPRRRRNGTAPVARAAVRPEAVARALASG